MTLTDWLTATTAGTLSDAFWGVPDRKVHLLTAAFLRLVWDSLPSHHTRIAVEATEKFADGRVNRDELARLRSADLLETCDPLWSHGGCLDEDLIGFGCECCEPCRRWAHEYECRVARDGYILDGVKAGIARADLIAAKAAFRARELVAWEANPEDRDAAMRAEAVAQYDLFREITGPAVSPRWPEWRTDTVQLLARGVHRDRAFDRLPILADALQDAGCEEEIVLRHCREGTGHVRGCWVVDLAMGVV